MLARLLSLSALLLASTAPAFSQSQPAPNPVTAPSAEQAAAPPTADEAWIQLHDALASKNVDTHIQAVTALGLLGNSPEAFKLLSAALGDKEVDVRCAAIVAAGETKNRNFTTALRSMLDDHDPQVGYTAASTLWKMGDHSGEDVLVAVALGDRKASGNLWNTGMHHANRQLHDPVALAKFGALQASAIFLPPVGIGLGAYHYMHGADGASPRVLAIEQIATEKNDYVKAQLITATTDKDTGVRLAAAEALAEFRGPDVTKALGDLFGDSKVPVRLIACAAYLRVTTSPAPRTRKH